MLSRGQVANITCPPDLAYGMGGMGKCVFPVLSPASEPATIEHVTIADKCRIPAAATIFYEMELMSVRYTNRS